MKTNSLMAWILAARPKTLTGAASPVLIGTALATTYCEIDIIPVLLCFIFAFMMQIDANFINDYFDYKKGIDNKNRLGPKRACSEGWITPEVMKRGIIITTALSCIIGLPLIYYGGPYMILIGIACVVFSFLYTTLMAKKGMGDILVLLFFGIIPVCTTFYILTKEINFIVFVLSLACGLVIDCLLVVNNYRDRDSDLEAKKITLVIRIGEKTTENLYLWLGIIAVLLCQILWTTRNIAGALLPVLYLFPHYYTWKTMTIIKRGKELNNVLSQTARNMFIFGLLLSIGLFI